LEYKKKRQNQINTNVDCHRRATLTGRPDQCLDGLRTA
jgi:hypothetical protein